MAHNWPCVVGSSFRSAANFGRCSRVFDLLMQHTFSCPPKSDTERYLGAVSLDGGFTLPVSEDIRLSII